MTTPNKYDESARKVGRELAREAWMATAAGLEEIQTSLTEAQWKRVAHRLQRVPAALAERRAIEHAYREELHVLNAAQEIGPYQTTRRT